MNRIRQKDQFKKVSLNIRLLKNLISEGHKFIKNDATLPSNPTGLCCLLLVSEFQILTLAVVPLEDPVTISLKENVPEPELSGLPITSVGATEYPTPVFQR